MSKISVTKIVKFEMAHKLKDSYSKECQTIHGHSYKLEVTLSGDLNQDGMIMDFKQLKEILQPIISIYDHKYMDFESCGYNPTAENMAMDIFDYLKSKTRLVEKIKLWETDTCFVEVSY